MSQKRLFLQSDMSVVQRNALPDTFWLLYVHGPGRALWLRQRILKNLPEPRDSSWQDRTISWVNKTQHTERVNMKQGNPARKSFDTIADLLICPRCLGFIPSNQTPGACSGETSRTDDETKICDSCCLHEEYEILQLGNATRQALWPNVCRIPYQDEGKTTDARVEAVMNAQPHWEALNEYLDETGQCRTDVDLESFENAYLGQWDSFRDYVSDLAEDCGFFEEVPAHLLPYFDMDRYAHDIEMEGMSFAIAASDGSVWVFARP